MTLKSALLAGLIFLHSVISVQCSPALCGHVLKEVFNPPKEWVKLERASPEHEMILRINLVQPNFSLIREHLYAVSDPASPRYGKHLSKEDVEELIAPDLGALETVNDWLTSHGFNLSNAVRSGPKDWIKVKTTVQKAEEMLNTTYHLWKHSRTDEKLVRTTSWSVPEFLDAHIDLVHPTTMFRSTKPQASTTRLSNKVSSIKTIASLIPAGIDPSCNNTITPSCILQLYNATQYAVQAANKGNAIAIASYLEQFANIADLTQFYTLFRPEAVGTSFDLISIRGGENNQTLSEAGIEADLDIQNAFGITFPTPATVYTTGGSPPFIPEFGVTSNTNEPYLDWLDFVLTQKKIPQSISTSYADDEQTVPLSFAQKVCSGFALLGARGVSVIFGSGDGGVGDDDNGPDPACLTNDGKNQTKFIPVFPASCPFVTSVGATINVPEVAVSDFGSGGGFSNYFPRPAYQNSAVLPFLSAIGDLNKGFFNPNGRAIPDVSAQGDNYQIIWKGRQITIGGTSASSPTFAAIVALLNDARIAAGKPPLGFLNPLIYSVGNKAFNDVIVGSNPGCGTPGFFCRVGWDAGFGTPNFGILKDIVLKGN